MAAGDSAFYAFDNDAAWKSYARAHAADSTDCTAIWKLARAYVHRAAAAPKEAKLGLLSKAEELTRGCVAMYPDSAEGHFFLAVTLGRTANEVGGKRRIALSREIKQQAEVALALEPRHWGAMHLLGRWNLEVASLNWFERSIAKVIYGGAPTGASIANARTYFEQAVEVYPASPLNHLWLGEVLIRQKEYARAREELQDCIARKDIFWDDFVAKDRAKKRLEDIEGKK